MKRYMKNLIFGFIPQRLKYSKEFWNMYLLLQESKNWSKSKLQEFQFNQLKAILNYAYKNSKYYTRKFDEYGINIDNIKDFQDFYKKVPVLTKEDVKANLEDMIAVPEKRLQYVTTGGSTGIPLGFYLEKGVTYDKTLAFEWRQFNEGGYYFKDKVVVLRGKVITDNIYLIEKYKKTLYLSTFDMTEENMHKYVRLIENYKPKHIRAYPSAAEIFSKFVKNNYPNFNQDKWIESLFTSSETLMEDQLDIIKKALNVSVFDKYGNSEQCGIIGQCSKGNYHEYMEYSYLEYLDEINMQQTSCGRAKIIGTSFYNYAVPFIRYDTGDMVEINAEDSCSCGMQHTVIRKIIGRWKREEQIVGNDNNLISLTALNTHSSIFDNVLKIQYVQNEKGKIVLNVLPAEKYTSNDRENIYNELKQKLKENVEFSINETDKLKVTRVGKCQRLIQNLDLKDFKIK